jgi:Penicillin-insensitive murein endopeptidase
VIRPGSSPPAAPPRQAAAARPRLAALGRRPLAAVVRHPLRALLVAALAAIPTAAAVVAAPNPDAGARQCPGAGSGPPVGERSRRGCGVPAAVHRVDGAEPRLGMGNGAAERRRAPEALIVWRRSRAVGRPDHGRLRGGVELPGAGTHFVTVDPVTRTSPNRAWRRHGTDRLVKVLLRVAADHAAAHPHAPRLVVGDLSRPRGGRFGPELGGDGHRSHQNGLDADVYYPRRDGLERIPARVGQVDRKLAQELVDRFVRAGAQYVFVGPKTGLRGPREVVMTLGNHDDHLHVRIRPARPGTRR